MTKTKKVDNVRNVADFCKNINASKKIVTWDATIDKYANTAEKFKTILSQPEFEKFGDRDTYIPRLKSLLDRCVNTDFQIAFVGTIKAGKSTLINAILGQNIASTRVTPETAVLTKFRHSEENRIKVKFYTNDEWRILWKNISNRADKFKEEYAELNAEKVKNEWINHSDYVKVVRDNEIKNELEIWSSSKHPEHYFVKEIEVELKALDLPENVVFVDTPGLDDPVKYRSDVTRNYIERANAVFVCVTAHALTGPEMKIISSVFANSSSSEKIYIIGTQTDNLNNPDKDWKEQHKEWIKYLSDESAFGSAETAKKQIIPTAAYMENLCREYMNNKRSITDDDNNVLYSLASKYGFAMDLMQRKCTLDDCVVKMKLYSNINSLIEKIRDNILSKYKEFIISDIKKIYLDLQKDLNGYFSEIKKNTRELLDMSDSDINSINKRLEDARKEVLENKNTKEILTNIIKVAKEDNDKRLESLETVLSNLAE